MASLCVVLCLYATTSSLYLNVSFPEIIKNITIMGLPIDINRYKNYGESVLNALQIVFRRLVANLLLNFEDKKFREVRRDNPVLVRSTNLLPSDIVEDLFTVIGFELSDTNTFIFNGTRETLLQGEKFYSFLEESLGSKRSFQPLHPPPLLKKEFCSSVVLSKASTLEEKQQFSTSRIKDDFDSVVGLKDIVRTTLLKTGRVRNSFFEARDFSLRRMSNGRVYACSSKCDNLCLEAHWHLISGKNLMYSHIAHLSPDGSLLLHLGHEVGYQYHMIPGLPHFGKTINFNTKLLSPDGKLISNDHPNRVVDSCIYCGKSLEKLFFC